MFASRRIQALPPYVFAALDARVAQLRAEGHHVIDLGRADPDRDSPQAVVAALLRVAPLPENHHYPPFAGVPALRQAVARWYADRHGVEVDPEREVLVVGGAKEGLFHISLGVCDPGDVVLVPDPSFPAYRMGAYFAGAEVVSLPLRPERGYLPDLAAVPAAVAHRAKALFLNYPNNPTGAVAPRAFLAEAVAFARRHGILLCHDLAYGESGYGGYRAPSVLGVEEAKGVAVEFISWSKAFCMAGWRLGAAVGNAEALAALRQVESQVNTGVFAAVQAAGAAALEEVARSGFLNAVNDGYRARRDRLAAVLGELGLAVSRPRATPFLWVPCPDLRPSQEYAAWLLERTGIAVAPGSGFGAAGEGFLRVSLTAPEAEVEEAAERLRRLGREGLRLPAEPARPTGAVRPVPAAAHLGPPDEGFSLQTDPTAAAEALRGSL